MNAESPGRRAARALLLWAAIAATGCAPLKYWVGMKLYYDKADLAPSQIVRNVAYDPSAPDDPKRHLDLYLPAGKTDFPVVVFIHGGGWAWGDRTQTFGGADVYGNIGRFLASQGFGAAVISYRLIWKVGWDTQVEDVARAVAWAQRHAVERGARQDAIFVMGHSAGAQLAMRIAADPKWLAAAGGSSASLCGVVAVSGTGYDFEDPETYRLDGDKTYYAQRFAYRDRGTVTQQGDDVYVLNAAWRRDATVMPLLDATDPPFLLLVAEKDFPSIKRQSQLAAERTRTAGINRGFLTVPGVNHERIVLELSRANHIAGPAILRFLRETSCPRSASPSSSPR